MYPYNMYLYDKNVEMIQPLVQNLQHFLMFSVYAPHMYIVWGQWLQRLQNVPLLSIEDGRSVMT
jgi:hypothetical protein